MDRISRHYDIPENIAEYVQEHNANLAINFNSTDAINGYGLIIWHTVVISMLTRTCHHCGYDPLWSPDDKDSKCGRHTYGNWRYDDVFVWSPTDNPLSLEGAFDVWLKAQPTRYDEPTKRMSFGKIGW